MDRLAKVAAEKACRMIQIVLALYFASLHLSSKSLNMADIVLVSGDSGGDSGTSVRRSWLEVSSEFCPLDVQAAAAKAALDAAGGEGNGADVAPPKLSKSLGRHWEQIHILLGFLGSLGLMLSTSSVKGQSIYCCCYSL